MNTQNTSRFCFTALCCLALLTVGGCASNYKLKNVFGGYSESQLSENMFSVSFESNGFTERERVNDFALLRSAEVTLDNDYRYFVVINQQQSSHAIPKLSTLSGWDTSTNRSTIGGTSQAAVLSGPANNTPTPSTTNTIVCFSEKPEGVTSYNAKDLKKHIKSKYEMDVFSGNT